MTQVADPIPEVTNEQLADYAYVAQALRKNVLFVCVNIHMWRGQYKVREAKIQLGADVVKEEVITPPRWKLLPDKWHLKFTKIEGKIRDLVDRVSLRFPIRGIDVVPRTLALELFKAVDKIGDEEFYPLADALRDEWEGIVAELHKTLTPTQWQQVQRFIPGTPHEVRRKFQIIKHVVPMLGGAFSDLQNEDATEYIDEITKGTWAFIDSTVTTITDSLHEELEAAVNNLVQRIDDRGVVKGGTMEMVERAFNKIKGFQFVMTPEVLDKVKEAERKLKETNFSELNEDNRHGGGQLADGLVKALRSVMQQCETDAASLKNFGRLRRTVEI